MNGPYAKRKKKICAETIIKSRKQKTKAFKNFLFYKISIVSTEL